MSEAVTSDPSDQPLRFGSGLLISRINDGKVASERTYSDQMEQQQMRIV